MRWLIVLTLLGEAHAWFGFDSYDGGGDGHGCGSGVEADVHGGRILSEVQWTTIGSGGSGGGSMTSGIGTTGSGSSSTTAGGSGSMTTGIGTTGSGMSATGSTSTGGDGSGSGYGSGSGWGSGSSVEDLLRELYVAVGVGHHKWSLVAVVAAAVLGGDHGQQRQHCAPQARRWQQHCKQVGLTFKKFACEHEEPRV